MPRLEPEERERLVELTVAVVLDLRAQYLRSGVANPLRHWDQIQSRMRAAARQSASPSEWATALLRRLQVGAPSSRLSASLRRLCDGVSDSRSWLDLIEREHGYILARARLGAEQRAEMSAEREREREAHAMCDIEMVDTEAADVAEE